MYKGRYILAVCCQLLFWGNVLLITSCANKQPASSQQTSAILKDTVAVAASHSSIPDDRLIIPGKQIGQTVLGEDASALAALGKPDFSDAAMGKAWTTWYGKKDEHNNRTELNVYTTYADSTMSRKTVQQIRITSPYFITADSIHVYSDIAAIRNAFPNIQMVGRYRDEGREINIYNEISKGIAFEITNAGTQQICTGIIVNRHGKPVTDIYMMLHPDMERIATE